MRVPRTLDPTQAQQVKYAVPLWLRDEQVKRNIAAVSGRVSFVDEPRPEPIAIVGFGPSLQDTWEQIKNFPYVMTCSGSHRFLIDRGIIPTYHVEVDPRDHKIGLLGAPHPDVQYLIASTCAPAYLEHLKGFNVKLWHVFDATEDGIRLLPPGEEAFTGGCDVGLRAMVLAPSLGFRDLHIFGLDGCARGDVRHAAAHPHTPKQYDTVEWHGRTFYTTPAMLEAARQTPHELAQLPGVKATFYGDGLTQTIVKDFHPTGDPADLRANIVGFARLATISPEYRQLNAQLHHDQMGYGVGGAKHAETVTKLAQALHTTSILDYGCGKSQLAKALPFPIWEYDPAIPEKSESPRPADLVICTDVLEHVEPDFIAGVLGDLKRCTKKVGFFVIHTGPAQKTLADGRNAHLLQRDPQWWRTQLQKYFTVGKQIEAKPLVTFVVGPKVKKPKRALDRASVAVA